MSDEHADLERAVQQAGGRARQRRQARLGKMTARERVEALLDPGSMIELDRYVRGEAVGAGVITALGAVEGARVVVIANDPAVLRGSLGVVGARRVARLLQRADAQGLPVLTLVDSDGARLADGADVIGPNSEVMELVAMWTGPRLSLICGLAIGAAAYTACLGEVVAMVDGASHLMVTGPGVAGAVTGAELDLDGLGGSALHAIRTGQCQHLAVDELAGLRFLRWMVGLVAPVDSADPVDREVPELSEIIPDDPRRAYDVREVVQALVDRGSWLELTPSYAPNIVTGVARWGGRAVAIVASQPSHLAGALDAAASMKIARHLRLARRMGLAVVNLVDVPGYLPGVHEQIAGVLRHGAALIEAYAATRRDVRVVSLVLRKCYGAGNVLSYPGHVRLALPAARVAPIGAQAAMVALLGPAPSDPDLLARHRQARQDWLDEHGGLAAAAYAGAIDQIVPPTMARAAVYRCLYDPGVRTL